MPNELPPKGLVEKKQSFSKRLRRLVNLAPEV